MPRWAPIIPMVFAVYACAAGEPPVVELWANEFYEDFAEHESVALPEAGPVAFSLISDIDIFDPDNLSIGPVGQYLFAEGTAAQAYDPLTQRHWVNDGAGYYHIGDSNIEDNLIADITAMGAYGDLLFFASEARQFAVVDATTGQRRVISDAFSFPVGGMCAEMSVNGEMVLLVGDVDYKRFHAYRIEGDPLSDGTLTRMQTFIANNITGGVDGIEWSDSRLFIQTRDGIWRVDNFPLHFCDPDLTMDGELDFLDISAFLSAYQDGNLDADFNGDKQFDFIDVSMFLSQYLAGCP